MNTLYSGFLIIWTCLFILAHYEGNIWHIGVFRRQKRYFKPSDSLQICVMDVVQGDVLCGLAAIVLSLWGAQV